MPSEEVIGKARSELAELDQAKNIKQFKNQLAQRTESVMPSQREKNDAIPLMYFLQGIF